MFPMFAFDTDIVDGVVKWYTDKYKGHILVLTGHFNKLDLDSAYQQLGLSSKVDFATR